MKLVGALLAWLVMAIVLAAGIVLAAHGRPALLVAGATLFLAGFVWFGCRPH